MIGLVRLRPSARYARCTLALDSLPTRGTPLHALVALTKTLPDAEAALAWRHDSVNSPQSLPLALVVPRDPEVLRRIALEEVAPTELLFIEEIDGRPVPDELLEKLWRTSVLGALEDELLGRWHSQSLSPGDQAVLRQLLCAGAAGRRVASTAVLLKMSEKALDRWLKSRNLPSPGCLLREARHLALRCLEEQGLDLANASRLCGWVEARAAHVALRRAMPASTDGGWRRYRGAGVESGSSRAYLRGD